MSYPLPPIPRRRHLNLIQMELDAYRDRLPSPDPAWPVDVRALVSSIHTHLFETGLVVRDLKRQCGTLDNNISARFAYYVGVGIKAYILTHQLSLSKHLLLMEELRITQIALSVGYASPSAFTVSFQNHVGCSPSEFRRKSRADSETDTPN